MKKLLLFCLLVTGWMGAMAQYDNSIALFVASAEAWGEGDHGFQGQLRMQTQNGEPITGSFLVQGDRYVIRAGGSEWYGDGEHTWELQHRSKRLKRSYYDATLVPAVVFAFRFYRMDLLNESVGLAGTPPDVTIDVEYGVSATQGSHRLIINPENLAIEKVWIQVSQDKFLEMAEIANLSKVEEVRDAQFTVDEKAWQTKGYSILNLAKVGDAPMEVEEAVLQD